MKNRTPIAIQLLSQCLMRQHYYGDIINDLEDEHEVNDPTLFGGEEWFEEAPSTSEEQYDCE